MARVAIVQKIFPLRVLIFRGDLQVCVMSLSALAATSSPSRWPRESACGRLVPPAQLVGRLSEARGSSRAASYVTLRGYGRWR